ncbi:cell division protein ZapB [Photorhabdus luminescens]|uniref:Cell division protein ZapB n=2 Tax=Morganellaceae TaxID=1903414 RepID=A0A1G5RJ83_PHOLU|nr:cell division protein ZapB [Photorhabdus luminescens]
MTVIFHVLGMLLDRGALATYNQTIAYKGEPRMSFEVFEKLEAKVQQAIDTITLLQMEIEELKEKNRSLSQEIQNATSNRESLTHENEQLKQEQQVWQERLRALLGKMEDVQ